MLNWLSRFNIFCLLDNHQYSLPPQHYDCLFAAGAVSVMRSSDHSILNAIGNFFQDENEWIFGHLNYDLKNEIEGLQSLHPDHIGFPDAFLFVPEYVIKLEDEQVSIGSLWEDHEQIYNNISASEPVALSRNSLNLKPRISRNEYVQTIMQLQEHIHRGDCYEINFCQEFYAENASINPFETYQSLSQLSPNPFSAFYRIDDRYLLCASPERFLSKSGNKILSQPIKGTISRNLGDKEADLALKKELAASLKDRTENVMIVDLVRNDLSKICREGTVKVEELFGVYAFPQVYQMISTIAGELKEDIGLDNIIKACFPMGSMTGAPKRKVLELIERYEKTRRGIFSGSIGYVKPGKDFDFNVVIRSIMFNSENQYLSFMAGSGITAASDPSKEILENTLLQTVTGKFTGSVIAKSIQMDHVLFNQLNPGFDSKVSSDSYGMRLPEDKMKLFNEKKMEILDASVQSLISGGAETATYYPKEVKIPEKSRK